jgi:predicted  nucleic acid-binding Zn ribbon protein
MHTLSIKFKKTTNENELWHAFWGVLASMRHNGQLVGRAMNPYKHNGKMMATIVTATADALEAKHHNSYVKKDIADLENLCGNKLEIKFAGVGEGQETEICTCKKSKHYLLRDFDTYSPIQCGTCYKSVPLYKLKKIKDDGYEPITSFLSNVYACFLLDIGCAVGEKWAIKQRSDPNTELGKQGIAVAKLITDKTGVQCYYYLHNYAKRSAAKDNARPCPSCGGEWALQKEMHHWVWFKCDKCMLMSGRTTNN